MQFSVKLLYHEDYTLYYVIDCKGRFQRSIASSGEGTESLQLAVAYLRSYSPSCIFAIPRILAISVVPKRGNMPSLSIELSNERLLFGALTDSATPPRTLMTTE